jgi:acetyl esterase/lipase
MHNRLNRLGFALLALLLASPVWAQEPALPDNVELIRDVEYGKGGDRAVRMHILRPKTPTGEPMPVLVWIHGGGWRGGSYNQGIRLLPPFAAKGYFCVSVEYRLSGEAKFPAQIHDCKCAIRYLRAHAKKYNIDPNRIGVWGASAGGHLVALLGTSGDVKELEGSGGWPDQSSRVQAVCDWFGPTEFFKLVADSEGATSPVEGLLDGKVADRAELAKLAAPLTHVSKDDAPILMMHGDMDRLVPLSQSEVLHEALKKAGVDSTLHVVKGAGHGFGGPEISKLVNDFFDRHLKKDAK